jgi:hypothetical protein
MKLAIMQPYFFPYLGYFQLISAVDKFILYDNLNFIKWGWLTRNRLIVNGKPAFIIVPVLAKSSFIKIRDIRINNKAHWKRKILNSIYLSYKKKLYFDVIFPVLEKSINVDVEYLTDLNSSTVRQIAEFLDISTEIVTDVSNYEALERNLSIRNSDLNAFYLREQNLSDIKTIRAISICKNEQAEVFINAIGGQELYDKQVFGRNGINLFFIHTIPYSYKQNSADFFPNMSIIDILMNCGKAGAQRLLNNHELI